MSGLISPVTEARQGRRREWRHRAQGNALGAEAKALLDRAPGVIEFPVLTCGILVDHVVAPTFLRGDEHDRTGGTAYAEVGASSRTMASRHHVSFTLRRWRHLCQVHETQCNVASHSVSRKQSAHEEQVLCRGTAEGGQVGGRLRHGADHGPTLEIAVRENDAGRRIRGEVILGDEPCEKRLDSGETGVPRRGGDALPAVVPLADERGEKRLVEIASGDLLAVELSARERQEVPEDVLLEQNPAQVRLLSTLRARTMRVIRYDLMDGGVIGSLGDVGVALCDPPWYREHYAMFLAQAARVCALGARVYLSMLPAGTRPGALTDRLEVIRIASELGLHVHSVEADVLGYEAPEFEIRSLRREDNRVFGLKNRAAFWKALHLLAGRQPPVRPVVGDQLVERARRILETRLFGRRSDMKIAGKEEIASRLAAELSRMSSGLDEAALEGLCFRLGVRGHLAILNEPYLSLILGGHKTIESRFSRRRCAPYERVRAGDILILKESSGPIRGVAVVEDAKFFSNLTPSLVREVMTSYAQGLQLEEDFRASKEDTCFASLFFLGETVRTAAIQIAKVDRRAWIVFNEGGGQQQLL